MGDGLLWRGHLMETASAYQGYGLCRDVILEIPSPGNSAVLFVCLFIWRCAGTLSSFLAAACFSPAPPTFSWPLLFSFFPINFLLLLLSFLFFFTVHSFLLLFILLLSCCSPWRHEAYVCTVYCHLQRHLKDLITFGPNNNFLREAE